MTDKEPTKSVEADLTPVQPIPDAEAVVEQPSPQFPVDQISAQEQNETAENKDNSIIEEQKEKGPIEEITLYDEKSYLICQ